MKKNVLMFITVLSFQIVLGQNLIYPQISFGEENPLAGNKINVSDPNTFPKNINDGKVQVCLDNLRQTNTNIQ